MRPISELLENIAEEFFCPENGSAVKKLVKVGSTNASFEAGKKEAFEDTYQILLGLSDHFFMEEAVAELGL